MCFDECHGRPSVERLSRLMALIARCGRSSASSRSTPVLTITFSPPCRWQDTLSSVDQYLFLPSVRWMVVGNSNRQHRQVLLSLNNSPGIVVTSLPFGYDIKIHWIIKIAVEPLETKKKH